MSYDVTVKTYDWNEEKNVWLQRERGVSFEQVLLAMTHGNLLDVVQHHNPAKYPDQRIFIVSIDDYVYLVPFVEDENHVFLKTIIPSQGFPVLISNRVV